MNEKPETLERHSMSAGRVYRTMGTWAGGSRMPQHVGRVVAGIMRSGNHVLLVNQKGPSDPDAVWSVPGGKVEDGELLTEALVREIKEESGLNVIRVGRLAYLTQLDNPLDGKQSFAYVYEIQKWTGTLHSKDPDGKVSEARFLTLKEAISKLEAVPWEFMRDPIVAYLRGQVPSGSTFLYLQEGPNQRRLIQRL